MLAELTQFPKNLWIISLVAVVSCQSSFACNELLDVRVGNFDFTPKFAARYTERARTELKNAEGLLDRALPFRAWPLRVELTQTVLANQVRLGLGHYAQHVIENGRPSTVLYWDQYRADLTHPSIHAGSLLHEYGHARISEYLASHLLPVAELKNAEAELNSTTSKTLSPELHDLRNLILPFEELAADWIAVIVSKNPDANAYNYNRLNLRGEWVEGFDPLRSFTQKHEAKKWSETNAHTLFSPTRSYLWEKFSTVIESGTEDERAKAIRIVLEATVLAIRYRTDKKSRNLSTKSPAASNQNLIRLIAELMN